VANPHVAFGVEPFAFGDWRLRQSFALPYAVVRALPIAECSNRLSHNFRVARKPLETAAGQTGLIDVVNCRSERSGGSL